MPQLPYTELKSLMYHVAVYNSESAYKQLFAVLFNSLYRMSYCMLKSHELAEEVVSDVMFKLWQKRVELLQVENVQVYALRIARNLSLNAIKQQVNNRLVSLETVRDEHWSCAATPEQLLINAQSNILLQHSINALPTRCRLVFKLIKEEGLSYKEVAAVLNISPKTVDAHLVTAIKKLANALKFAFSNF